MAKEQPQPVRDNRACEAMLRDSHQGVLVMCRGDVPYAVPMNHGYDDGFLYFHCAPEGMKLDFIRYNPSVVYVVTKYWGAPENFQSSLKCHGQWESVIIYGVAHVVEGEEELRDALIRFMRGQGKGSYKPTEKACQTTGAIVVEVQRMTARREDADKKIEFYCWEK